MKTYQKLFLVTALLGLIGFVAACSSTTAPSTNTGCETDLQCGLDSLPPVALVKVRISGYRTPLPNRTSCIYQPPIPADTTKRWWTCEFLADTTYRWPVR
jgi:hypothetical protein